MHTQYTFTLKRPIRVSNAKQASVPQYARCMPSVELTESVPMYVVIFKGIAPCPLLHTQVIQDKQPTHYKAHMLSGHGVLLRTILLANTTFVDLTIQTSNTTSIRRERCTYSLCFSHSAHGSDNEDIQETSKPWGNRVTMSY